MTDFKIIHHRCESAYHIIEDAQWVCISYERGFTMFAFLLDWEYKSAHITWLRISAAYQYYQKHWDRYLSTDNEINTLISFPLIYICIYQYHKFARFCRVKNVCHTLKWYLWDSWDMVIFKCWPWKSKIKIMGRVKSIVLASHPCTCVLHGQLS